jgi:hypothetical protein
MLCPMGVLVEQHMDQEQYVDRGAKAPPDQDKPKVVKRTRAAGAKAPSVKAEWLKPLGTYARQQRREYQVTRFG